MVEFPDPTQIGRICREEGISQADVERAFGHMRGLRRNGRTLVRKGLLEKGGLQAIEHVGDEPYLRGRIATDRGTGMLEFLTFGQLARIAPEYNVSMEELTAAFGHLRGTEEVKPERLIGSPRRYGESRRIKLGHMTPEGRLKGGIVRGQLFLFDGPSNEIIWGMVDFDDPKSSTRKIKNYRTSRATTFESAMLAGEKLGIPRHALITAFGHHMTPEARRAALRAVSQPKRET